MPNLIYIEFIGDLFGREHVYEIDGERIVNATGHDINFFAQESFKGALAGGGAFASGCGVVIIPSSGIAIDATPVEEPISEHSRQVAGLEDVEFVQPSFTADPRIAEELLAYAKNHPEVIVVGSLIAAQAYPGLVAAMVSISGFERLPPTEKRMNAHKFTLYGPRPYKVPED